MKYFFFLSLHLCASALIFSGCVPAATPPQLQHTPGAYVRVDGRMYDAGVFRAAYPSGWRIVKSSIAAAPMQVVFVSPDDAMTITLSETPLPEPASSPGILTRTEPISLPDGTVIYVRGRYPAEREAAFNRAWERVTGSMN